MTDRMREVELVEVVDEPTSLHDRRDALGSSPSGDGTLAARSWLRRHSRWLVPTAAVAVLAVVGIQLVADARERSRLEALAQIPGVLPPADPDIGVIWRADPELATVLQGGAPVDGLVVGGRSSDVNTFDLVALDVDTGAVLWTTPVELPAVHLSPGSSQASTWVGCIPVRHDDRELVGCISQRYGDDFVGVPDSGTWVVDPTDGSVVSHVVVPGGAGVTFTDDALVVADRVAAVGGGPAPADAGSVRWQATATDLVSGSLRWTYTTPVVEVPEGGPDSPDSMGAATLQAFDDRTVLGVDDHAWILGGDGSLVRDVALDAGTWIEGARSGTFIVSSYASPDPLGGALLLADGTSVPIGEPAAWLSVDDGSAPEVVFTGGQGPTGPTGFTGRDATSGEVLWHRDDPVTAGLLLEGVVYIATDEALEAVDAVTGRTLWSSDLDYQPQQISTDGRSLLVPGLGVSLHAFAISDGRFAWTKDLQTEVAGDRDPVYVQGFQSMWHEPRLYVWMDDGAVAVLG